MSTASIREWQVAGWQQRYVDPTEGPQPWQSCTERDKAIIAGRKDYEVRAVYVPAVPEDAFRQALVNKVGALLDFDGGIRLDKRAVVNLAHLFASFDKISPTALYDFAGWLTTRKDILMVGSSHDAAPMAGAVGEYLKLHPERFNV